MKKSIAFLLALVLSLTLLCGCGNAPADKTEAPADKTEAPKNDIEGAHTVWRTLVVLSPAIQPG